MKKLTLSLAALLVSSTSLYAQAADLVFTNASVLTMDDDAPTAQAVAVTGNQISSSKDHHQTAVSFRLRLPTVSTII